MSEAGVAEVEQDETEGPEIIRAKWIMDDATTLHEAAGMLRAEADRLEQLHAEGWRLERPVEDDYGFLHKPESVSI